MSGQKTIKYQIQKSSAIKGEGKIENIKDKILNRTFQLYSDQDHEFDIDLRFSVPSIISQIYLRMIDTERYQLTLTDNKNKVIKQINRKNFNKNEQNVIIPETTEQIRYVKLKIMKNIYSSGRLGIRYIIFKGKNDQAEQKVSKQNRGESSKNNYKIDDYYTVEKKINLKSDPKAIESKELFKGRDKSKEIKDDIKKLIKFQQFGQNLQSVQKSRQIRNLQSSQSKPRRKVKRNEDLQSFMEMTKKSYEKQKKLKQEQKEDTQLAIALSKSEHQAYEEGYEKIKMEEEQLPVDFQNYINQKIKMEPEQHECEYRTVDYHEDYIDLFADMSPQWFEAQLKAQIQHNVKQEDRLTNYVKIKWLYGLDIYISGFEDWMTDEIRHHAKTLGCKIIDEVKNHCLAIVPKQLCEKLRKKHKEWRDIKYLNQKYLEDCILKRQKVSFSSYYINI